jgi:4-carboxymuconolactone decarboxylase
MPGPNEKAPKTYDAFVNEFPKLGIAWEAMREAERAGPFSERDQRLLKLAVAIGSGKQGPVHSAARKAKAAGVSDAEIRHVAAIAASTIGLPPAVAAWSWIVEELEKKSTPSPDRSR